MLARVRILVTGFEPYLKQRRNPTQRLALEADGKVVGIAALAGRVLPTEFRGCEAALRRALEEVRPEAVIMFGLAPSRTKVGVEAVALNVDHGEDADNAGVRRWRCAIVAGGPRLLDARADIDALYAALKRARVPVAVSYHAGTYVCNHAFYTALRATRATVAFLHVPKWPPGKLWRTLQAVVAAISRGRGRR